MKIAITAMLLVVVIMFRKPCASSASRFVTGFDGSGSGAEPVPDVAPGILPSGPAAPPAGEFIQLSGSEAEITAAIEAARARARAGGSGSGSGSGGDGPRDK